MVAGSFEALDVHLYDAATEASIDLSGISAISAKAKNPATGTTKTITCAVLGTATNGNFRLSPDVNTWTETGTFDLQIGYTDASGNKRIYPSEGNQLKIKVAGAN